MHQANNIISISEPHPAETINSLSLDLCPAYQKKAWLLLAQLTLFFFFFGITNHNSIVGVIAKESLAGLVPVKLSFGTATTKILKTCFNVTRLIFCI